MLDHSLARRWYPWHRAGGDSTHAASHVCVPSRSTFARSRSSRAGGERGEIVRFHRGMARGAGSTARCRRRPRPVIHHLPACFLGARPSNRKGARNEDPHLDLPGSALPSARSAPQSGPGQSVESGPRPTSAALPALHHGVRAWAVSVAQAVP